MRVTYLGHSGFLVELNTVVLLFDWCKGEMPELPNKPLICFASHQHSDHFDPQIFSLNNGTREVRYLFGKDIKLTTQHLTKWGITNQTADKCTLMGGGEIVEVTEGVKVETLTSTDEGVAFVVSCEGKTIYHAGDLNWWHWEGEDLAWNRNMEVNFKRYMEPLRGRELDLAFVPLDARLEDATDWGLLYFLQLTNAKAVFPMHQWQNYETTAEFLAENPEYAKIVFQVEYAGQCWNL